MRENDHFCLHCANHMGASLQYIGMYLLQFAFAVCMLQISGLYTDETNKYTFKRPITVSCCDPCLAPYSQPTSLCNLAVCRTWSSGHSAHST